MVTHSSPVSFPIISEFVISRKLFLPFSLQIPIRDMLLGLGIHVHSPEWERICLWEVIRAGLFWTWRSQASGGEMWEKGFLIDSPL